MKTKSIIQLFSLIFISLFFISCGSSSGSSTTTTTVTAAELEKYLGTFLEEGSEEQTTVIKRNGTQISSETSTDPISDNQTTTDDPAKKCDLAEDSSSFIYIGEGTYPLTYDCKFEGADAKVTLSFDESARKFTYKITVAKQAIEGEEGVTNSTLEGDLTATITFSTDKNSYTGTTSGSFIFGGNDETGDTVSFESIFSGSFTGTRQ